MRIKKQMRLIMLFLFVISIVCIGGGLESKCYASTTTNISVYVDGTKVQLSQQPVIIENRTMVPLKAIFEAMGSEIEWNQQAQQVTVNLSEGLSAIININADNTIIKYNIPREERSMFYVGSFNIYSDVRPQIVNGTTMVSARLIGDISGYDVSWDNTAKSVNINKNSERKFKVIERGQDSVYTEYSNYYGYGIGDGYKEDGSFDFTPNGLGKKRYFGETETIGVFDKSGSLNGYGTFYDLDDDAIILGYFTNNVVEGYATEYYLIGNEFITKFYGTFEHGKYKNGTLMAMNGDIYEGDLRDGLYNGEGDLFEAFTGNRYIGSFYNGMFNGKGTYSFAGGAKVVTGTWDCGTYVGDMYKDAKNNTMNVAQ